MVAEDCSYAVRLVPDDYDDPRYPMVAQDSDLVLDEGSATDWNRAFRSAVPDETEPATSTSGEDDRIHFATIPSSTDRRY